MKPDPDYHCRLLMTHINFKNQIQAAVKAFDRHVISLEMSTGEFMEKVLRLCDDAIKAYDGRAAHQRNGIGLDRNVTVILTQRSDGPLRDSELPRCHIYFNLSTDYWTEKDSLELVSRTPVKRKKA